MATALSVSPPQSFRFSIASVTSGESSSGESDSLSMTIADAQSLWEPAGTYLNTASYGLPPRPAHEALDAALADWRGGRTSWEHWGDAGEEARASFARLVGAPVETVAIGRTCRA